VKRRLLLSYLVVTLLPIGACLAYFTAEIRATGIASGPVCAALGAAALAFGLGVAAVWRIGRADPRELDFLGARYLRIVFSLKMVAFALVLFGSRSEPFARFAAHLLAVMALHRLALLWPGRLRDALRGIERRPIARNAELLLFNLCATAVLAEGVLRVYYASSGRQGFFDVQREHPATRKLVRELFGAPPNTLGYNDEEFAVEKRPGVRRVAAVGDSFFVAAVPRAEGVIARAEALLASSEAAPVEVFNFGIVASDVDDYLITLEEDALRFSPDLVLLGVYVGNDLRFSRRAASGFNRRSYAINRALLDIRERTLARRLVATGAFRDITQTAPPAGGGSAAELAGPIMTRERYLEAVRGDLPFFTPASAPRIQLAYRDTLAGLARIEAACRARGVPLVAVISPSHAQVSPRMLAEAAHSSGIDPATLDVAIPQRRLAAFFAERGIPALDLLPAFQRAARESDPDGFYLNSDTHWSVAGNEIAAQEIARFVADHLARSAAPEGP
jgi:hypothetical protein